MSPRFTTNLALVVLGGVLLTASLTFGVANASWIALGAGATAFAVPAIAFPGLARGATQRKLDVVVAALGLWILVASRVFDGSTLRWLSFGGGCALVVLGAFGLVLHELDRQRRLETLAAAAAEARPAPSRNGSGNRSAVPAPEVHA